MPRSNAISFSTYFTYREHLDKRDIIHSDITKVLVGGGAGMQQLWLLIHQTLYAEGYNYRILTRMSLHTQEYLIVLEGGSM